MKIRKIRYGSKKIESKNIIMSDLIDTFKKEVVNKMNDDEEEKYSNSKKQKEAELKRLKKGEKKNDKVEEETYDVEKAKNKVKECNKIMKNLREENLEILKLNALYVIQNSKKYFVNESLEPNNYKYINDIVRNKLMKDLLNFNPKIHMKKLESLAEINPEIKKDLDNLKKNIDLDLDELLDKHYYKKKELELKEKFKEERTTLPKITSTTLEKKKSKNNKSFVSDTSFDAKYDNSSARRRKDTSAERVMKKNSPSVHMKDKPISIGKKNKISNQDQKNKKNKKQNMQNLNDLFEIYGRCKDYLETGSPLPDNMNKYFDDIEKKFLVKSNITKTNVKNAVQFKVKAEHPEYKQYFDLENPKYLDHQLKSYFPKLELAQNSLQDIQQRRLNENPGKIYEEAHSLNTRHYQDIKTSIERAKLKVQDIIPKQELEDDKKIKDKQNSLK